MVPHSCGDGRTTASNTPGTDAAPQDSAGLAAAHCGEGGCLTLELHALEGSSMV